MRMPVRLLIATLTIAGNAAFADALSDAQCAQLVGLKIPAASIGLPTEGAVISAAQWKAASGSGSIGIAEYCLVSGKIMPIDSTAPNIQWQIALPKNWNSKIVMLGGGGFDGTIPNVAGNFQMTPADSATPLGRGYAVFGSDSGHQAQTPPAAATVSSEDAAFFSNSEAYRNYIGDALKKTRDAALTVINKAYGRTPAKSYFFGGSKGGQEALAVAGRWPADWDGIVALYPARNYTLTMMGALVVSQALAAPGAYLNAAKRGILYQAALAACDELDGAKDGVISNVRGCYAAFDPASATLKGGPLRCAHGSDAGDTCLSDAQLGALKKAGSPFPFSYLRAGAQRSFLGYNIITSDLGSSSTSPMEAFITRLTIGSTPPAFPAATGNSYAVTVSDYFMRLAVAKDPSFNQLTLNLANPGPLAARLNELYSLDQVDADLTPFAKRGGKLLILQGSDDMLISPRSTEAYVQSLRKKMGAERVDSFLRYYEVPAYGHSLSTIFSAVWDQLPPLDNWVEKGMDPAGTQIVTDTVGVPGRTRPLCLYPSWPKYRGSGDLNVAASFSCVDQ
jgi:Tannase and feruloyl esterase